MGQINAPEPKKRPHYAANVTNSSAINSDSARKCIGKRRAKNREKKIFIGDVSTAPRPLDNGRANAIEKRRKSLGKATCDSCDEPAAETKLPQGRRSPIPVIDFDGLSRPSNATRSRMKEGREQAEERLEKMRGAVRTLLGCIGEDPDREGLLATPSRYAKALLFLTKGYQVNVENIVNNALFHEGHNEMVAVKDIEIYSLCEHHLLPFAGKVYFIQIRIPSPIRSSPSPLDAHRLHPFRYRPRAL